MSAVRGRRRDLRVGEPNPNRGFDTRLRLWCAALSLAGALSSSAHQGSTSYLTIVVEENRLAGRWEIPVKDLDLALGLDTDKDLKVSAPEWSGRFVEVQSYALQRLQLRVNDVLCALQVTNENPVVREFSDGESLALDFVATNVVSPRILSVDYTFMFDQKPLDQAFLQVDCRGVTQTSIFTANATHQQFDLTVRRDQGQFLPFVGHGVEHIWTGYDHILFLIALLLPAVLRFHDNRWLAVTGFHEAFLNVLKVVTAFTVAHSVTLSLAALQVVSLPSRWVESAIAASVLVAAANNLRVFFQGRAWLVAFGFGLVHGFGFASVLIDFGLPKKQLAMALVGFNLGVELGQIAVVLVFLPLAFLVRRFRLYQWGIMKLGSVVICLVAAIWLLERAFDTRILGF